MNGLKLSTKNIVVSMVENQGQLLNLPLMIGGFFELSRDTQT